jgi:GH35 family endo-1,4-beta-xylanase
MKNPQRKAVNCRICLLFVLLFSLFHVTLSAQNWYDEAWSRIDTHRKSDLSVNILSESGVPINGASVKIQLKRHAFNFGAAMRSEIIHTSPDSAEYKDIYLKYFNGGGFDLGLKPRQRGGIHEGYAEQVIPWFNQNNIDMRGHAFVWEGESFLRPEEAAVYNDTSLSDEEKADSLLRMLDDHMYHAMPKWDVKWWDVINEPVKNNIVNNLLPDYNTFTHWFKLADSLRSVFNKDFKLVLNENQVISGNATWVEGKLDEFQVIVDEMIADGAPIEMLGFQSRIKYGMISPDTMYNRLLRFDKYNLPIQATEFEVRNSDQYTYTDNEVKQQTEDAMLVYFSHPKVEGFWHWTFVDDASGNFPWALFNYDGTPKPTGEKWIELMEGEFDTDTTLISDASGNCLTRGFKGEYEIEITYDDTTITETLSLNNDTVASIYTPFVFNTVNVLTNSDFETGSLAPWNFYNGGADASANVVNGELEISINTAPATWKPQLEQSGFSIITGKEYRIGFDAKAEGNRTVELKIQTSSGVNYLSQVCNLSTSMQQYSYSFIASESDSNARIRFNCGSTTDNITLDNIVLDREVLPSYSLSVVNGSGDGEYEEGTVVNIVADAAPAGQEFSYWSGNVGKVADVNSANTIITIPSFNVTVTANYITNLLVNGDFETGSIDPWDFYTGTANAEASVVNGEVYLNIISAGNHWQPQLVQSSINIVNGNTYQVRFNAKAEANRTMKVLLQSSTGTNILDETVNLTTSMQTYTFIVTAGVTDANCTLKFNCGLYNSSVTLDNVSISNTALKSGSVINKSSISSIAEKFIFYPNPTRGLLNVSYNDDYSITLYNLNGVQVKNYPNMFGTQRIYLHDLAKGIYLIKVNYEQKQEVYKLIVR